MRSKGFTLVELLATIVIIAIVLAIAIPGITGIVNSVKVRAYQSQIDIVEKAAKEYILDDFKADDMKIGETISITLQQLYDERFLTEVKNPSTNEVFDPTTVVYVTKKGDDKLEYTYENGSDCRYNGKTCLKDNVIGDLNGKSQSYQGGTYYKGTNEQITNNYVWYSGQEYRIMGINSDGSIKMVTSLPVVSISWGPTGNADYTNSYARKWLNILPEGNSLKDEYEGVFYKSLNRPDLIQDYAFCIGKQDPTSGTDTTCSTKVTDKIGLMTWWEYKIAGPNANGTSSYLDQVEYLSFLTGDARINDNILISNFNGSIYLTEDVTFASYELDDYETTISLRPVINLKSTTSITIGNGTATNPYRLVGDEPGLKGDYLSSRNAGEYLNFNSEKYRIISKNSSGNTKIVMDGHVTSTGTASGAKYTYFDLGENATNICTDTSPYTYCNNHFDITDGSGDYNGDLGHNVGYFLNSNASNSFYNSLGSIYQNYLEYDTYYFGKWSHGSDYKLTYTNALSYGYGTQSLKVGMLMYGEMLAGNNLSSSATTRLNTYFINSPSHNAWITRVSTYGYARSYYPGFTWHVVRPVLTLKSGIKIVSGEGTKNSPYEIIN